jgi:hypothetical protein
MISILEEKKGWEMNIHELFQRTRSKFSNPDEFIYSLDVLYLLDMIEVDFQTETIRYAKNS